MKTDDIEAVMEALQTIAFNVNSDALASRFYGKDLPVNPMDVEYIRGKLGRLHDRGIVHAYGDLDSSNRRNFHQLVKDVIAGKTIPGIGRWS